MKKYDSKKAGIVYLYRKRIEPIVGNGGLRKDLVKGLESVLDEVLPSEELSIGDYKDVPIDYDSFNCSLQQRNRIRNALNNSDVMTYGDLLRVFSNAGHLRVPRGIGKKAEEIIFQNIESKGFSESFKP